MRNPYSTPRPRRDAAGAIVSPARRRQPAKTTRPDPRPAAAGAVLAFTSSSDGAVAATLADLARLAGDDTGASGTALTYQVLRLLLEDPARRARLAQLAARRPGTSAAERRLIADLRALLAE